MQKANIAIVDGDAVSRTFSPTGMTGNARDIHLFTEAGTDGSPVTESKLTYRKSALADGSVRHTLVLRRPVTTSVDGVLVETAYTQVRVEFTASPSTTLDDRNDSRILASNALLNAIVADSIDNNRDMW